MTELCYGLDVTHVKGLHPDQCAGCARPDAPLEQIPTQGITGVGEITTRVMREAIQEPDFVHARQAGASEALGEALQWVLARLLVADPYDDVRALREMVTWLGDKIREVNSSKQIG